MLEEYAIQEGYLDLTSTKQTSALFPMINATGLSLAVNPTPSVETSTTVISRPVQNRPLWIDDFQARVVLVLRI